MIMEITHRTSTLLLWWRSCLTITRTMWMTTWQYKLLIFVQPRKYVRVWHCYKVMHVSNWLHMLRDMKIVSYW